MNKLVGALLAGWISCLPVQAEEFNTDLKSYCGPESLEDARTRERLAPWFLEIDRKIRAQVKYSMVANDLLAKLAVGKKIFIWIVLSHEGKINTATLNSTTGSESLDKSILNLTHNLFPLKIPSNSDCPKNVQVMFHNTGNNLVVSTNLNTRLFIHGRIGQ